MAILCFTERLVLAFLLGAPIGIGRQWLQKSTGIYTNTLALTGSAALFLLFVLPIYHVSNKSQVGYLNNSNTTTEITSTLPQDLSTKKVAMRLPIEHVVMIVKCEAVEAKIDLKNLK